MQPLQVSLHTRAYLTPISLPDGQLNSGLLGSDLAGGHPTLSENPRAAITGACSELGTSLVCYIKLLSFEAYRQPPRSLLFRHNSSPSQISCPL